MTPRESETACSPFVLPGEDVMKSLSLQELRICLIAYYLFYFLFDSLSKPYQRRRARLHFKQRQRLECPRTGLDQIH